MVAADEKTQTVTVEGVGKDEKEARKAAFRAAVSKVVGTLIDAETMIKNNDIISEKILEFSGGFVKSYDTLKTDKTDAGFVRVRIKAEVERTTILGKLKDARVSIKEVKGVDLAAEKMTKEEARKNATELLAKLFDELPKCMRAEVVGKPKLTDDEKGVNVEVQLSADPKLYMEFSKKAATLLDKISTAKDSVLLAGTPDSAGGYSLRSDVFGKPDLGAKTPRGYAIWLLTFVDGRGEKSRWNLYWVDADLDDSVKPIAGKTLLKIELNDIEGGVVNEDEVDCKVLLPSSWFMRGIQAGRS